MMDSLLKRIENNRKAHTRWLAMVLCLSMIVSLGTFAGFRQTAVAKTYTKEVLDCPYAQEGASPVAHVHNDDCYDGDTLVCTLPEREAHTHTEECFAEQRRLTCVLEENPGHQHGDACYAAREEITCGLEENPGHVHNGTCFNESGVLICTMAEGDGAHTHTADCFTTVYDLICDIPAGEGAHTHTDECYTTERVQVCGQEELPVHVHGPECIRTVEWNEGEDEPVVTDEPAESTVPEMPVSDPDADLETADDWNREFENLELSGNWARDLILVAATQQGRGESPNNFEAFLNDAGDAWVRYGYTRYGAWYGVPYANEWSAMFVSFCLRYAGIPEENVPNNPTAAFMAESFQKGELFAGRDYVPAVGDLIFFDTVVDDDITNIDHMGIVYHVDAEDGTINTVEGDRTDAVATFGYHLDDEQIVGYGILPQNPNYNYEEEITDDETDGLIVMTEEEEKNEESADTDEATVPSVPLPAQSWERTAGGIKVTVDAPEGAFPENTTIAVTPVNGNSLKDTVSDAVSGEVLEVQAVDITFFDADGHEIEPAVPIRVVMTPAATENAEEKTSVVHVDVAQQTAELIEQAAGTELDNSEVVFDADAFTIYAIVYTVDTYFRSFTGETFRISMDFDENAGLPQNAELKVKEIFEESADYNYSDLLSQAESALEGNKQISFVRFFDISIVADGEEVQPLAPVSMKIQLAQLPEETAAADAQVIHFGDQAEVLTTEAAGANVSFETASFSVYGVVYTVDFEYEVDGQVYQFSMSGGDSILLSELVGYLGILDGTIFETIDDFINEISNVEFSNYNLIRVTRTENDWQLDSLAPFDTVESLTITMKNGDMLVVTVTDAQDVSVLMKDAVTSVTAEGLSGSEWKVQSGEEYTINLSFQEKSGVVQFEPNAQGQLEYQMPNNFTPTGTITNQAIALTYTDGGKTFPLEGCTYSMDATGKITIQLTPEAEAKIRDSAEGKINLSIKGEFTETNHNTDFGGGIIKDIDVAQDKDLTIQKTGRYDSSDNKVHYTVKVKAKGSQTNIRVKDVLEGTALKFDQNSFKISNNSSAPEIVDQSDNGFELKFPSMKHGEEITIEYTASVNWDNITGRGTVQETKNGVITNSDQVPEEKKKDFDLNNQINYNPLRKTAEGVQDTVDPDIKRVTWSIWVNEAGIKDIGNAVIRDRISAGSTSVMAYSGEGISIQKYTVGPDGTKTPDGEETPVSWFDLGVDPDSDKSWNYTITNAGKNAYKITYTTDVDVSGKNGNTWVSNSAEDDHNNNTGDIGTNVGPGSSAIGVDKEFNSEDSDKEQMSWTVTLEIPAEGLDKAIFEDFLPKHNQFQDTLDETSLTILGLQDGESFKLTQGKGKFTVTFYQDTDKARAGLQESKNGNKRYVTISFKTNNDPAWVASERNGEHENEARFTGNNTVVTDKAKGKVPETGIEKRLNQRKQVTFNNETFDIFEYYIDLYGIKDSDLPITIEDTFDSEYLEFLDVTNLPENNGLGLDEYWAQQFNNGFGNGDHNKPKLIPAINGSTLSFTVTKADLPLNNGEFYNRYQIRYYMRSKSGINLLNESLKQADRTLHLTNTAKWNESTSKVTTDYSYQGLKKEIIPASAEAGQGSTGFRITINPDKLKLNNGDPMTLTDVYSDSLSVDYSSVKFEIEPDDYTISYDFKGNTATYTIPDEHKVIITYDSKLVGEPFQWVDYGNKATLKGFTSETSGRGQVSGEGDASVVIYSVKLYKYEAGHMETPISGAEFTLVDQNGDPITYPLHAKNGKAGQPVVFKTESTGYVNIRLSEEMDGFSLQKGITYYLKETKSPDNYSKNNTTYRFTISDSPDYSKFEYHSGDILKIYDWPILGKIELKKTIDGPTNLTREDKEKIKFEITGTYRNSGTPIKVDEWGYTVSEGDLNKYSEEELAKMEDFAVKVTYADFDGDSYVMADLVDGLYVVKETQATLTSYGNVETTFSVDGVPTYHEDNQATVTIENKSSHTIHYTNKYTNKTGNVDITIKKVYKNGQQTTNLYGAEFKLEKKDGTGSYVLVTSGSVDDKGIFSIPYANKDTGVTLTGLEAGEYRITEVKAPANYKKIGDGQFNFTISADGTISLNSGSNFVDYSNSDDTFTVNNDIKHSYTVTKVDGVNVSLKLPGAEFGVWESTYNGNAETALTNDKKLSTDTMKWKYTTNSEGQFEIQKEDHEYEDGKLYLFKEIKAPEGYPLNDPQIFYFFFSYDGTPPAALSPVNLGVNSAQRTIENKSDNLVVNKSWKNLQNNDLQQNEIPVDSVEFVVYRSGTVKNAAGDTLSSIERKRFPDADTVFSIERVNNSWVSVTIPNAPAVEVDKDGHFVYYSYEVEETVPEGFQVEYSSTDSGRKITMTNRPETNRITVKKIWDTPSFMDPIQKGAEAKLHVYEKDADGWKLIAIDNNQVIQLNSSNNWEKTFEVEKGKEYKIEEFETAPGDWKIDYFDTTIEYNGQLTSGREVEFSETGSILITNTYKEPYLEIQKEWDTEGTYTDLEVYLNIYRRNITDNGEWELWKGENKDSDKAKISQYNKWKLSFVGSELNTEGDEYEYYVSEYLIKGASTSWQNAIGNYFITYSVTQADPLQNKGTITITNADKHDGSLTVNKKWQKSDGSPLDDERIPENVEVILQRAEAQLDGYTVKLNAYLNNILTKTASITVNASTIVSWKVNGDHAINGERWACTGSSYNYQNGYYKAAGIEGQIVVNANTTIDVFAYGSGQAQVGIEFVGEYEKPDIGEPGDFADIAGSEVTLHKPNWTYTWENLKTDAGDGKAYVYNVREVKVNGKAPAKAGFIAIVDPTNGTSSGSVTLTNKEIAKGSLKITKEVTVGGKAANGSTSTDGTYSFRVTDSAGTKHIVSITITGGVANTEYLNNLPEGKATVQEISSDNTHVTLDKEAKEVNIIGNTTADSPNVAAVTITNDYDATGSVPFKAKKVYEGGTLKEGDFEFTLTETDNTFESAKTDGVAQTKTNDANGDVVFDSISYTVTDAGPDADHPKQYYYLIKETKGTDSNISYDETPYKATVSVYDNGDGTLNITKAIIPAVDMDGTTVPEGYDAQFVNTEIQDGALKLTKVVTVDDNAPTTDTQKALTNGVYEFTIHSVADDDTTNDITVKITFEGGKATKYQIGTDEAVEITEDEATGNSWSVIVPNLTPGDYTITETVPMNGTELTVASGGKSVSNETKVVTVTVKAGDTTPTETAAIANFTNNTTTTELNVSKVWDSSSPADHPTSVTFKVYRIGYYMDGDQQKPASEGFYPNDTTVYTITGQNATKVKDLPTRGLETVDGVEKLVTYVYQVVEQPVEGDVVYWPSYTIDGTTATIKNTPVGDAEHETELYVTKEWKGANGSDVTDAHKDDQIEFAMKQVPHATGYVPVTLLYVNADGTPWKQQELFVKKGESLNFTFKKGITLFDHWVEVTVGSLSDRVGGTEEQFTFLTGALNDATTITAKLTFNFKPPFIEKQYDRWGDEVSNQGYSYRWTSTVTASSGPLYTDYESFYNAMVSGEAGVANESVYSLGKSTLTKKSSTFTFEGLPKDEWSAEFKHLPQFQKVGNDYVVFTYEISELTILPKGAEAEIVGETSVTNYNGETSHYYVNWSADGTSWTITNTEKATVDVDAVKAWADSNGDHMAPPDGATVTFELFADGEATGKTVALDGKTIANEKAAIEADETKTADEKAAAMAALDAMTFGELTTAWKAEWKGLQKYKSGSTTEEIVYTIKETVEYSGFETIYVKDGENEKDYAKPGETITNKQSTVDFDILKVAKGTTTPLEGASFTIQKIKESSTTKSVEVDGDVTSSIPVTTGDDGKVSFKNISAGYYEVKETQTPDGYVLTGEGTFYVKVDSTGIKLLKKIVGNNSVSFEETTDTKVGNVTIGKSGTTVTFTVENTPGSQLPNTGGTGTSLFTALGGLMTATAGAILTMKSYRRRKENA